MHVCLHQPQSPPPGPNRSQEEVPYGVNGFDMNQSPPEPGPNRCQKEVPYGVNGFDTKVVLCNSIGFWLTN